MTGIRPTPSALETLSRATLGNSLWLNGDAEPYIRSLSGIGFDGQFATFACFTAPVANTITKLACPSSGAAGLTMYQLGLYTVGTDDRLTAVAMTANNPGAAVATGVNPLALSTANGFPVSFTFVPGRRYAFGVRFMGPNMPSIVGYQLHQSTDLRPYMGLQIYYGTGTAFPGVDKQPFFTGGSWWNAPYIVGLK